MKTFILSKREDGRVVLDTIKHSDAILQEIKANSWLEAREKVKESSLWHNPGYGWYER